MVKSRSGLFLIVHLQARLAATRARTEQLRKDRDEAEDAIHVKPIDTFYTFEMNTLFIQADNRFYITFSLPFLQIHK